MFQHTLQSHDVTSTLRMEKGTDINAACGQLRLQHEGTQGYKSATAL
jgi:adenine C2-methylase RlmN of 23S rRNA A2503 and tRNA A37